MPRLAANLTMMFNEIPFLDRFAAARAAGFSAVEFLFPYDHPAEEIAGRLGASSLALALFNLPPGDWAAGERGLAALPGRRADLAASIRTALPYARATGVPRVHLMAGLTTRKDSASRAAYEDAVRQVAEAFGAEGIGVVIEPINGRDMPGYFLDDFDFAADLIDRLALPNLGLQFDIYHRQILHGDVSRALERLLPIIRHVQIAAVPQRHEPGTGELDDFRLLRLLDGLGYDGFVGCEYRPAGETVAGLDWMKRL